MLFSAIDMQFPEIDMQFAETCESETCMQFAEIDSDLQFTLCCSLLRLTCYLYAVCQD